MAEHNVTTRTGVNEDELFYFVEYNAGAADEISGSGYCYWRCVFQYFLKRKSAVCMSIVFLALVIFSFVAPEIGKFDYLSLMPDYARAFLPPDCEYWFGTDHLGRDYWCQVWRAAQTSIKLALICATGECVLGVIIGLVWGYVRRSDRLITEIYNLFNTVPTIIYMTLIIFLIGRSFTILCISVILTQWLMMARNVRNLVIIYRDREYNLASRALGTPTLRILVKNLLPHLISVIILRLCVTIPGIIGLEATLSYLGLGLSLEHPSLGILLRNARAYFLDYPHLLVFPAAIVSLITVTFYLAGNAFADGADPRNHV